MVTDVAFLPEKGRGPELLGSHETALFSVAVDSRCQLHLLPSRRESLRWGRGTTPPLAGAETCPRRIGCLSIVTCPLLEWFCSLGCNATPLPSEFFPSPSCRKCSCVAAAAAVCWAYCYDFPAPREPGAWTLPPSRPEQGPGAHCSLHLGPQLRLPWMRLMGSTCPSQLKPGSGPVQP